MHSKKALTSDLLRAHGERRWESPGMGDSPPEGVGIRGPNGSITRNGPTPPRVREVGWPEGEGVPGGGPQQEKERGEERERKREVPVTTECGQWHVPRS